MADPFSAQLNARKLEELLRAIKSKETWADPEAVYSSTPFNVEQYAGDLDPAASEPKPNYVQDWYKQPSQGPAAPPPPDPNAMPELNVGTYPVAEPATGGSQVPSIEYGEHERKDISPDLQKYLGQIKQPEEYKQPKLGRNWAILGEALSDAASISTGHDSSGLYNRIQQNRRDIVNDSRQEYQMNLNRAATMRQNQESAIKGDQYSRAIEATEDAKDPNSPVSVKATMMAMASGLIGPDSYITADMMDDLIKVMDYNRQVKRDEISGRADLMNAEANMLRAKTTADPNSPKNILAGLRIKEWNEANALRRQEFNERIARQYLGDWMPAPGFSITPDRVKSMAELDSDSKTAAHFADTIRLIYEESGPEILVGHLNGISEATKVPLMMKLQHVAKNGVLNEHEAKFLMGMIGNPNSIRGIIDHEGTIARLKQIVVNMHTELHIKAKSYGFIPRGEVRPPLQWARTVVPLFETMQPAGQGADLNPYINSQTPLVPEGTQTKPPSPTWDPSSGTPPVLQQGPAQPQQQPSPTQAPAAPTDVNAIQERLRQIEIRKKQLQGGGR